jgi:hypothetical protein
VEVSISLGLADAQIKEGRGGSAEASDHEGEFAMLKPMSPML